MGQQHGRNNGLTGLIDIPGMGAGAKFECSVLRWSPRLAGAIRPRRGRGGGTFRTCRFVFASGTVAITAEMRGDGWPAPDAFKAQAGTITVQPATGKTIAYPVLIREVGMSFDAAKQEVPVLILSAEITGAATCSGWSGTQPAAVEPTKADQEQWGGTSKTIDPQGLQSNAATTIDVYGTLADTDAAESAKLAAVIAAATAPITTPHSLKVRSASLSRDSIDGGTISIIWTLTDTKDDIENQGTNTRTDAANIGDAAIIATVTSSSTPPSAPAAPVGKLTDTTTRKLNDSRWVHSFTYGNSTSAERMQYDGTRYEIDPDSIADGERWTIVNTSSTPPATPTPTNANLFLRRRHKQRLQTTPEKWVHTFDFAYTTEGGDIENHGSVAGAETYGQKNLLTTRVMGPGSENYTQGTNTVSIDPTADIYVTVGALRNAFKDWTTFDEFAVQRLNNNVVTIRAKSHEDFLLATASTSGGWIDRPWRWYSGALQVYMAAKIQLGSTYWLARISEVPQLRMINDLYLTSRRKHSGTPPWNYNLIGTSNNGSFLGNPAGTWTFKGVHQLKDNLQITQPRVCDITYHIIYDSLYWVDASSVQPGWIVTSTDLSGVAIGWVAASTFGFTGGLLPGADYSSLATL